MTDIKDKTVFANPLYLRQLFGNKAYAKLQALFNPCCDANNTCCPSKKYTIEQEFVECVLGPGTKYNVKVTSNTTLDGPIGFTVYAKIGSSSFGYKILQVEPNGIAESSSITITGILFSTNIDIQLMVIDSRGNWSDIISFTTDSCT